MYIYVFAALCSAPCATEVPLRPVPVHIHGFPPQEIPLSSTGGALLSARNISVEAEFHPVLCQWAETTAAQL
jgi:hypothetical protein